MNETLTLQFDGGSRGNPGPAGIGVVILAQDNTPLVTLGRFIGRATNNVAEYKALITALQEARRLGARRIIIRGDSELVIRQMRGEYRVKHPDMKVLYAEARDLVSEFDSAEITHNLRGHNELADRLANLAMDRKGEVTEVSEEGPRRSAAALDDVDAPAPVAPKRGDQFHCPRCGCAIELKQPSSIRPHQLKPFVCQCGAKMGGARPA
jgi:ribonuclease HI